MIRQTINNLKKHVFYEILNSHGRVFIIVKHSDNVVIGKRGFTKEEKEKGLILVFNTQMNFDWQNEALTAKLVFGTKSEHCFIPSDDIICVFSPELNLQFTTLGVYEDNNNKTEEEPAKKHNDDEQKGKIIKVDFSKKEKT